MSKLREVMLHEDLEEVTSRQLRLKLEKEVDMQLSEYREFLDRQMLRILGQMEQPSEILDYLYLVSGESERERERERERESMEVEHSVLSVEYRGSCTCMFKVDVTLVGSNPT